MTATTVNKRFIYTCGGKKFSYGDDIRDFEVFLRLDTLKIKKGWAVLEIKMPN